MLLPSARKLKCFVLVAFVVLFGFLLQRRKPSYHQPPPGKSTTSRTFSLCSPQKCYSCHGPEVQQAGLRLDLRQNALRGGDYGPVIKIGDSAASKLIRRVVDGDGGMQMPPTGAALQR